MRVRFKQLVKTKRFLFVLVFLIFLFLLLALGYLLFVYNPEKPVKINAGSFTTAINRNEVAHLLGNAIVSEDAVAVLGVETPIEVKKEGKVQKAEFSFNALAPVWEAYTPEGTEVTFQIRVSEDGQNWSDWKTVEKDEDGDAKDGPAPTRSYGRIILLEGEYIQQRAIFKTDSLEKIPEVKSIEFVYIDSKEKLNFFERLLKKFKLGVNEVFAASDIPKRPTDKPSICSRVCWKADESIYVPGEEYVPVKKMIVHHTVTSNNDSNPAATVRAIYYFHNVIRGWGDIGYNFLIDQKNGTIYEGRYGGDSVVGAHTRGYNRGSVGVAVLGDFRYVGVNNKVRNALHKIAVWKFYTHKIDPDKSTPFGNPKRWLPPVFYHGQVGNTVCAGTSLNNFVPSIKKMAHYMAQQIVLRNSSGTKKIGGSSNTTVSDLLKSYRNKGTVAPNYIRKISAFPSDGTTPPNDPNYSSQWDLTKLDALNVWEQTSGGNPSIKVAVLDTGVAYEDYDPPGSEIYAKGPDFVSTNFVPGYDYVNSDIHPNDNNGHGTAVASVIASSTNDGVGSASIAYNVSIMPVKVCDKDGWCLDSDIARGVDFARTNEAKVINLSMGSPDSSSVIQSAIDSAWNAGTVVVAAAGNDGKNKVSFPARGSHVIGVGALTRSETRASYSNYGSGLDLMAPGGDAGRSSGDLLYQEVSCTAALDCTSFSYNRVAGTSFSAALVSASAALVINKGVVWPNPIERYLKLEAQDLGFSGPDSTFGWGLIQPNDSFQLVTDDKPHQNGTLIITSKSGKAYQLENGQKRWVTSRAIYERRFNWENLVVISTFEANSYLQGSNISFPNGALLQGSSNKIYVLENAQRRWITSRRVFEDLGYEFSNIIKIPDSELNSYTTGANVSSSTTHPDGSLVTSNSTNKIYLVDSGQKRWIPSRGVFDSRYFLKYVLSVSQSELDSYPTGLEITYPDGSLIRSSSDPNQKIYIVSTVNGTTDQTKYRIIGRLTFEGLGFKWKNVSTDSDTIVDAFTVGGSVY